MVMDALSQSIKDNDDLFVAASRPMPAAPVATPGMGGVPYPVNTSAAANLVLTNSQAAAYKTIILV
jgi:hypothetical protein